MIMLAASKLVKLTLPREDVWEVIPGWCVVEGWDTYEKWSKQTFEALLHESQEIHQLFQLGMISRAQVLRFFGLINSGHGKDQILHLPFSAAVERYIAV